MNLGILFDYNGVIANDEHLHEIAFQRVLAPLGINLTPDVYRAHFLGRTDLAGYESLRTTFPDILAAADLNELVKRKQAHYQELLPDADILYPKVSEVLESLARQFRMVIVTSSFRNEVVPVLAQHHLDKLFSAIVTADMIKKSKPDPEGYLLGLAAINLSATQVVVIEDSPSGVRAARNAGLKVIAVAQTSSPDRLNEADIIVDSVQKLTPELIHRIIQSSIE